jgi:hypothetical protein
MWLDPGGRCPAAWLGSLAAGQRPAERGGQRCPGRQQTRRWSCTPGVGLVHDHRQVVLRLLVLLLLATPKPPSSCESESEDEGGFCEPHWHVDPSAVLWTGLGILGALDLEVNVLLLEHVLVLLSRQRWNKPGIGGGRQQTWRWWCLPVFLPFSSPVAKSAIVRLRMYPSVRRTGPWAQRCT